MADDRRGLAGFIVAGSRPFIGRRIAVCSVAVAAMAMVSAAGATVGGAPSNDVKRCDSYSKPCGTPVVVAEGRMFGQREVVGLHRRLGVCLSFELVGDHYASSPCDENAAPRPRRPLRVERVTIPAGGGGSPAEIGGVLRPDVTEVRASYRLAGARRSRAALTSQLDGELARRIGFGGPVGVFYFASPGNPLAHGRAVRLRSYNSDGELLGVRTVR